MRIILVMFLMLAALPSVAASAWGRYSLGDLYVTDESDGVEGIVFQTVAEQGSSTPAYAVIGGVYPTYPSSSASGDIVIPETLNGVPVRKIGVGAFVGNNSITSVQLPANLREIGERAFAMCVSLTNVTVAGPGLSVVSANAFSNCVQLSSVTLPATLQRIGRDAFALCDRLSWVHFEGNAPMLDAAPADPLVSYFGEKRWTSGIAPERVRFYVNAGTYGWCGPYLGGVPDKWPLSYGYMNAHPVSLWSEPKKVAKSLSVHMVDNH